MPGLGWGGGDSCCCVYIPICSVSLIPDLSFILLFDFIKFIKDTFLGLIESQNNIFSCCSIPCCSGSGCLQITSNAREILKMVKDN